MTQNQQINNSLLTYNIIQTLPSNTLIPWHVSLAKGSRHPLPLITPGKRKHRRNDPDPGGDGEARPVVHLVAETCLGSAKKANEPQDQVFSVGFYLGMQ